MYAVLGIKGVFLINKMIYIVVFLCLSGFSFASDIAIRIYYMQINDLSLKSLRLNKDKYYSTNAKFDDKNKVYVVSKENFVNILKNIRLSIPQYSYVIILGKRLNGICFLSSYYNIYPSSDDMLLKKKEIELIAYPSLNNRMKVCFSSKEELFITKKQFTKIILETISCFCEENECDDSYLTSKINDFKLKEKRNEIFNILLEITEIKDLENLSILAIEYYRLLGQQFYQGKDFSADKLIPLLVLSLLHVLDPQVVQSGLILVDFIQKNGQLDKYLSSEKIWALMQIGVSSIYISDFLELK
jgi:hypothetical protein